MGSVVPFIPIYVVAFSNSYYFTYESCQSYLLLYQSRKMFIAGSTTG